MISSLTGRLNQVDEDRVHLLCGPMVFEILVPAQDVPSLRVSVGQELTFHTIFDIEGDATRGGLAPRLIGFVRAIDKQFFLQFITVKGIGPKRALRALVQPIGHIARAIETRDARFLVSLPEIGKRTAEQIVAELSGKMGAYVMEADTGGRKLVSARQPFEEDAIVAVITLGVMRGEAERLLDRAKTANANLTTTDGLVREMLHQRAARS